MRIMKKRNRSIKEEEKKREVSKVVLNNQFASVISK